jgi:thymidylate synthase (FAD)
MTYEGDGPITIFEPHGFVRLVKWMGDELDIVNAARVSFANESEEFGEDDIGLIGYLLKNKHGSPFEQGFEAHWHIRLPIFVMREWVRHRIGHSVNEESGRYSKMRGDFFYPDHIRMQKGKPGAYTFERIEDEGLYNAFLGDVEEANRQAWFVYEKWLGLGLAKEQARIALPLNLYTEIRWTSNARSLMNFLTLRNSPHAMYEIREYARVMEGIFRHHMPTVATAFELYGRVAP